jgi:hypothetical protein
VIELELKTQNRFSVASFQSVFPKNLKSEIADMVQNPIGLARKKKMKTQT